MRRFMAIAGIAITTLLLSSCVNFGTPLPGSIGTGPTVDTGELAAVDLNDDLRPEALVMRNDGSLWWVERCTFDQCLVAHGPVTPPAGVNDLATGDFDENGVDDVVAAANGGVQVFFGRDPQVRPDGGLVQSDSVVVTGAPRKRVIVADLNDDANLDVGVLADLSYEYYPGNGAGQFGVAVLAYSFPQGFTGSLNELAAADVDGNGGQDAVIAAWYLTPQFSIAHAIVGISNVTPILGYLSPPFDVLTGPIAACDLDNDGRADLAQRRELTNDIRLLRSVPDENFTNSYTGFGPSGVLTELTAPGPTNTIRLRDFDANGTCDVVAGWQGGISWWHGNGGGAFVTANGISRIDRSIPDLKSFEVSLDTGDNQPDLWVSQGQPNGRVSFVVNTSQN